MKVIFAKSLFLLITIITLAGCGSDDGPATVPTWMRGERLIVYYGYTKVVTLGYYVTFTRTGMIYNIGGCEGEASIEMDTDLPYYVTNDYRITITRQEGCEEFDFESILGAVDEGVIWGEYDGDQIHRYSFRQNDTQGPFRWIYAIDE